MVVVITNISCKYYKIHVMKMKNVIQYISIVCLTLTLQMCENKLADDLIPERAYILNSGTSEVSVFRNNKNYEYLISINKSGIKNKSGSFRLVGGESVLDEYNNKYGTSYKLISEENYHIDKTSFDFSENDRKITTHITVDITKVKNFVPTNVSEYAIALKLESNSNEIEITKDKQFLLIVPRLRGGIRDGSGVLLWEQTLEEMGVNQVDNNTISMAVTEKYLYVNTRNSDLRFFDRFTGKYVGTIVLPFKGSLTNFSMASDRKNSVIISSLRRGTGTNATKQDLYRIDGTNPPVLFTSVTHNLNNGRKLSIVGDLNGEAIVCSVEENEANFIYWRTEGGQVISNVPERFTANPLELAWTLQADVYPLDLDLYKGVYMTGYGNATLSKFAFVDGLSHDVLYEYDLVGGGLDKTKGWATHSIDMIDYNDAKFLALGSATQNEMHARLLHIEEPSHLTRHPLAAHFNKFMVTFSTGVNAQSTGDVLLATSNNGEFMQMYVLGTNGGVKTYQFDSAMENDE